MSEKTNLVNPTDLPLPKDREYKNTLEYRQPKPEISSTEMSDDEDRSGETIDPPIFTFLEEQLRMANQGTGVNAQQIVDRAVVVAAKRANIVNVTDVAGQFAGLSIESQKAKYLAPDDIVKKYQELEIQYQRDKVYNGKVICAILDFVKTLKDPPQELDKFVEEIKTKKMKKRLLNCAIRKSFVFQK
jgi:hypothetical protein